MTRGERLKALRELYAELPKVECKGRCARACGPIAMSTLEREVIEQRAKRPVTTKVHPKLGGGTCSMLTVNERCSVYGSRPLLCRLYGVADGLTCFWGCEPERLLSRDEARAFMLRAMELGGQPDLTLLQRQVNTYLSQK